MALLPTNHVDNCQNLLCGSELLARSRTSPE